VSYLSRDPFTEEGRNLALTSFLISPFLPLVSALLTVSSRGSDWVTILLNDSLIGLFFSSSLGMQHAFSGIFFFRVLLLVGVTFLSVLTLCCLVIQSLRFHEFHEITSSFPSTKLGMGADEELFAPAIRFFFPLWSLFSCLSLTVTDPWALFVRAWVSCWGSVLSLSPWVFPQSLASADLGLCPF